MISKSSFARRAVSLVALAALAGCTNVRVVRVPTTETVELGEDVWAHVVVPDKDGNRIRSTSRVRLFEGEYVKSGFNAPPTTRPTQK